MISRKLTRRAKRYIIRRYAKRKQIQFIREAAEKVRKAVDAEILKSLIYNFEQESSI